MNHHGLTAAQMHKKLDENGDGDVVKTEFVKFGEHLGKLHKQLNTAANTIGGEGDTIQRRLRAMERALKDVEALDSPSSDILKLLDE